MYIIISLFLIGAAFFIWKFKRVRLFFMYFLEFYGMVYLLLFSNLLLMYIYVSLKFSLIDILSTIISLPGYIILAAVGLFYFKKINFLKSFYLVKFEKEKIISVFRGGVGIGIILSIISVIVLYFKELSLFNPISPNILTITMLSLSSIVISVFEETYLRLFLLSLLSYYLKKLRFGFLLANIITSLLAVLIFFENKGFDQIVLIQVFVNSIVWGYVFKKRGWDTCVIGHAIFKLINFTVLSNGVFLMK